jgi:hypothetical protein
MKFLYPLILSMAGAAAAPVNDQFAARISLGGAASADAAGNNTGATLEAGENDLDAIGGASVWWKWTALASGWVTADTSGSAIDTVLAVLADGPSLGDTFIVGCNDESGDPAAVPGTSRVVFQATAGTEYHFAVHGFLGAQGAVALHVRSGTVPALRVTSLTLAPASVNVTTANQSITTDVGIASDAGFSEGVLAIHRSNFSGVTEVPLNAAQRASGTAAAGVYRVSIPVARYSQPGTWLLEVALSDLSGNESVYGRGVSALFEYDFVLPDGLPGLFSVTNTGSVDVTAPQLTSFTVAPAAVNVVNSAANLTFTFQVTDALSGFGSATLTLFTPGGEALTALPVTAANRTAGTAAAGTYGVPFSLPAKMPGGVWTTSLLIRDATGNPSLYDGAVEGEDFPAGAASGQITVTGAAHSYWAWMYPRLSTLPGTQPNEDFDGDGISNLLEYALGLNVAAADAPGSATPSFFLSPAGLTLSYVRRSSNPSNKLSYSDEFGSALNAGWTKATSETVTDLDGLFERVTVTDPAPVGSRRFGRVTVTLP